VRQLVLAIALAACGSNTVTSVDAPRVEAEDAARVDSPIVGSRDPADDGDYAVTTATAAIPGSAQNRTLQATVFTPTGAPTPRPLVVVSPGFQLARTQFTSYARHLASWGFVVVLTDYAESGFFPDHDKMASDIPAVITWALAQTSLGVDATKVATAGHSLGGKLSVFAAAKDPRIKAVVAWDPVDSSNPSVTPERMAAMTAAIAVIGETTNGSGGGMPCAPAAENFQQFYAAAPSPALAITVAGADHMDWVDDPSCLVCGFCSPGTIDPAVVRTVTRRLDVAWLRLHLSGDTAMNAWLDAPPEAAQLTITRR
jgi:predicted dienelactone hydrolase